MVVYRCCDCRKLRAYVLDRHQRRRLYTPSMDAYQRFEREMVGLDVSAPRGEQGATARAQKRRKRA
jgi:hypothetical protein